MGGGRGYAGSERVRTFCGVEAAAAGSELELAALDGRNQITRHRGQALEDCVAILRGEGAGSDMRGMRCVREGRGRRGR